MYNTLFDMLTISRDKFGSKPLFHSKVNNDYQSISYSEFYEKVIITMSGLIESGFKRGDKIFIFCDNRMEWMLLDFAMSGLGIVSIPRGTDTAIDEVSTILNHSNANYIIVENNRAYEKISKLLTMPIISIDDDIKDSSFNLSKILKTGEENLSKNRPIIDDLTKSIGIDDLVTIIYTSGTTGNPKGVMLTHRNFIHNLVEAPKHLFLNEKDTMLSVLPIWHIFERTVEYVMIEKGAAIVYSSIKTFVNDIKATTPTMLIVVPRILESFYEKILYNISKSSIIVKFLFHSFYFFSKLYFRLDSYVKRTLPFWEKPSALYTAFAAIVRYLFWPSYFLGNKFIFKSIHKILGGKMRVVISGGGSLPNNIDEFFNIINIRLVDGYGLTETSPIICLRKLHHPTIGVCGAPIPNTETKIIDPEGKELGIDEKGELIVKGTLVTKGYYNNPEATAKAIQDGWFHTGDLVKRTYFDEIKVIGRLKDTIVLLGGENVEPEKIETIINRAEYIESSIVLGQNQKRLKALIIPRKERIIDYANSKKLDTSDYNKLLESEEIYNLIKNQLNEIVNNDNEIKKFERIYDFKLLPESFEVGKELTQSLKLKRHVIADLHKKVIEELLKKK